MLLLSKYLKYYILILLIDFGFYESKSQNLISNGSFESYTSPVNCSGGSGGFDNYSVFPVNHVVNDWFTQNSPDYFSVLCSGINNNGSPINIFGYSSANNGTNYAGFILFQKAGNLKEYIFQQLSTPLQSGKVYCLSFYVSRADRITHAIKNIGAYFSNSLPTLIGGEYISAIPQVENHTGYITDTIQWTLIQGCFIANGGEQYITIGNFNSNATTDTLFAGTNNQVFGADGYAYYYIDNITLIDQSTVGVNELSNGSNISVYPNPAIDVLNINIGNLKENTEIKIYNAFGVLVLSESLTTQNSSLKTHHFQNGIYFYYITHDNKVFKQDKLIIIK